MSVRIGTGRRRYIAAAAFAGGIVLAATGLPASADGQPDTGKPTVVYLVEHGQPDFSKRGLPLSDTGWKHARAVAAVLRDIRFTNVFSSNKLRSRQTVSVVAGQRGLSVVQLPPNEPEAPSGVAAKPLIEALKSLPPGSIALVGGNRENIFAVMHGLGIPVKRDCRSDQTCVPCTDKHCFGANDLNSIWQVTLYPKSSGIPVGLQRLHTESPNTIYPPGYSERATH